MGSYSLDPSIVIPNNGDISLGDVNRDGRIDITDASLIATYSSNPTDPSLPTGIGAPVMEGKMYWVDATRLGPKIQRANLDGSQVEDFISTGLGAPSGLALDLARGKIYWTDVVRDRIQCANLDGSQIETLVTGLSDPVGLALDIITPDLVAASPSANPPDPVPRQSFTLSVKIHNQGSAPTPPTTVHYYLSTDSTITNDDTEVGTDEVSGLAASGTIFKLIQLRAPSNLGTYYYGACVQPVSGERNIQNNCSSASEIAVNAR